MVNNIRKLANQFVLLPPPRDLHEQGLRTFAFGALYSLAKCKQLGYSDDTWSKKHQPGRIAEIGKYARMMKDGKLPRKGKWLAEYYFNNALLRVDVGFERIAKFISEKTGVKKANSKDEIDAWCSVLKKAGAEGAWLESWKLVRKAETNFLKHHSPQLLAKPRMTLDMLEKAVEHLIQAIKWAATQPNETATSAVSE